MHVIQMMVGAVGQQKSYSYTGGGGIVGNEFKYVRKTEIKVESTQKTRMQHRAKSINRVSCILSFLRREPQLSKLTCIKLNNNK